MDSLQTLQSLGISLPSPAYIKRAISAARDETLRLVKARQRAGLATSPIWAASAVGVLLGVGLYAAALVMAVLCLLSMSLVHEVERKLPGRAVFDVSLSFCRDTAPELEQLAQVALTHGYRLVHHSLSISFADNVPVWRFWVIALDRSRSTSPARLAHELSRSDEVLRFSIVPLKN